MATLTMRPTSGSGSSWSNITNAYDGNDSTNGTVSVSEFNYSSRYATFSFSSNGIPNGATINSATLTIIVKQSNSNSSRRITVHADINEDSSSRVISQQLTKTTSTTLTADMKDYMSDLSSIKIIAQTSSFSSNTFTLYEIYIDVDYTESSSGGNVSTKLMYFGDTQITAMYLGSNEINSIYIGDTLIYQK